MAEGKKILWKQPKEKEWFSFIVDGKCVATLPQSAAVDWEKSRLCRLIGIQVRSATPRQLIKVNALTVLPKRILRKMQVMAYRKEKGII